MDANETVRRLILGSQSLDRMRSEISLVIKTLAGLICESSNFEITNYRVPTNDGYWTIEKNGTKVEAGYIKKYGSHGTCVYSTITNVCPMHLVEEVYSSLPGLVQGLFGHLGELEERCRPIISASYVFESTVK